MQDVGGLAHFHHEGRAAAGQIVGRADAGENAVERPDHRPLGGDEAADMSQQRDQGGLTHQGGFAAGVGTSDDQHPPLFGLQHQVVGRERLFQRLFDHRMTAGLDLDSRCGGQFRRVPAQGGGPFGQVGQHVQFRQRGGAGLQRGQLGDQMVQQGVVQDSLPRQRPILGVQHLVLEFLQFRSDVTFRALEGLAAEIVGGHRLRLGAGHLDVVAMHPVETELESADAGALAFPRFQFHQILIGAFAQAAQLVEFGIVAGRDHPAIAQGLRRVGNDRPVQQVADFGMGPGAAGEVLQ